MKVITAKEITKGLKHNKRIYLCGKLQQKNAVEHIENEGYEIGISKYDKFTCESAHYHALNNEYNYVLKGQVKVWIFDEEKEYTFSQGDLYLIEPNMPYITKAQPDTMVLFSKTPGGNDKVLTPEYEESVLEWTKSWNKDIVAKKIIERNSSAKEYIKLLREATEMSLKDIIKIWSVIAFIWGITSTFMGLYELQYFIAVGLLLSVVFLIKYILEIKKDTRRFDFGENKGCFVLMKDGYTENMQKVLSDEQNAEKDFYFAMGIDRSLSLAVSTHKGILFSVLGFLKENYGLTLEDMQEKVNAAKARQFSQKEVLDYGDILKIKIEGKNNQTFYLLLIVNSVKKDNTENGEMELVGGPDSRIIILKLFEYCREIDCENLFVGAFGTNGLHFPYDVVVSEIINAYVKNQKVDNGIPKNVYLSVRKEDMERHNVNHSDIVWYIQRVKKFYRIQ